MLVINYFESYLMCDKCERMIRYGVGMMSKRAQDRYLKKKIFCGRCFQARLNRNNPDFDYELEFGYKKPKPPEIDDDLRLLLSCMC